VSGHSLDELRTIVRSSSFVRRPALLGGSFADADSVDPSRTIASSTSRLCGGKEGRPLGLKHVALRIADALSLVGDL